MRNVFSGEPGRSSNEMEDKLQILLELLSKRESKDLDLFVDILSKIIDWKSDK